jgi:hypothetical protein
MKRRWRQYWLVLSGLLFIVLFVLIRAASFNHVDYLLSKWRIIGPFKMKYVVELGGIFLVGVGALQNLRSRGD